ncbi:MAG: hypothetical protein JWM91_1364 [Rhodospirillales bacterium]|nr:hypothetical protein [Rhodospirillales bacterium]
MVGMSVLIGIGNHRSHSGQVAGQSGSDRAQIQGRLLIRMPVAQEMRVTGVKRAWRTDQFAAARISIGAPVGESLAGGIHEIPWRAVAEVNDPQRLSHLSRLPSPSTSSSGCATTATTGKRFAYP